MSQEPLRVGLLLERMEVSRDEYESLRRILSDHPVDLTIVAVSNREDISWGSADYNNPIVYLLTELLKNRPWVLVEADFRIGKLLEDQACTRLEKEVWGKKNVSELLDYHNADIVEYDLESTEGTPQYEVRGEVVDQFRENADVIVNFEHGILDGDILEATTYGVLSFHASDIRKYRGRPPHVWQYINNEPFVGNTIQQLTPVLDGGKPALIKHQEISPTDTWWDLKYNVSGMQAEMYSAVIGQILGADFDPDTLDSLGTLTHSSDKQRWSVVARILGKNWTRRVKRGIASALGGSTAE